MARSSRFSIPSGQALPRFLAMYVALQPLLDVLTSLAAHGGISLTAGTVVRTLFMGFAFFYVVFCGPFPGRKALLTYLGFLTGYLAVFTVWSFAVGGLSVCLANVSESLKTFYFPYSAALLYALYRQTHWSVPDWAVSAAGLGYAGVILLACITGTSFSSYNAGYGYSGWFYAANDVSIVIMLTAPLIICQFFHKLATPQGRSPWVWVGLAIGCGALLFSAAFLGTKLVYLGVLLYLAAACLWFGFRWIRMHRAAAGRCLAAALALTALLCALYPVSPLNHYVQDIYVPMSGEDPEAYEKSLAIPGVVDKERVKANARLEQAAKGTWLGDLIETQPTVKKLNWLLSRRLLIIAPSAEEFTKGGAWIALFGLGYAQLPSYQRPISHLIEMEGVALLLRHGIVGFLLYYVPFLAAAAVLLFQFFRRLKARMTDFTYCSLLFSAMMACATSLIAGHTLASPSVSLMVAILYGKLMVRTSAQNQALAQGTALPGAQQLF